MLKGTSSNISIDPIELHLSANFKFFHKRVYPTISVKNMQIYGVQRRGKWNCKSKN